MATQRSSAVSISIIFVMILSVIAGSAVVKPAHADSMTMSSAVTCSLSQPMGIAFDPANNNIYVADSGSNTVSVIGSTSNLIIDTISVGASPNQVAYDPFNEEIYVSNAGSTTVSAIDSASNSVVATINVDPNSPSPGQYGPYWLAFNPTNNEMYVTNYNFPSSSNTVAAIDSTTNTVTAIITVGQNPIRLAYDPSNGDMYVADYSSGQVSVITSTNSVVATIGVPGNPDFVGYDPANGEIYVASNNSNEVTAVSSNSNTVVATVTIGGNPYGATYDPANGEMYVSATVGNAVYAIDSGTNTVAATVAANNPNLPGPYTTTYDPANTYIYASDTNDNSLSPSTVTVINTGNAVVTNVAVGAQPDQSVYDLANNNLYVVNHNSDSVSAIGADNSVVATITSASCAPSGSTIILNIMSGISTYTISFVGDSNQYAKLLSTYGANPVLPQAAYLTYYVENSVAYPITSVKIQTSGGQSVPTSLKESLLEETLLWGYTYFLGNPQGSFMRGTYDAFQPFFSNMIQPSNCNWLLLQVSTLCKQQAILFGLKFPDLPGSILQGLVGVISTSDAEQVANFVDLLLAAAEGEQSLTDAFGTLKSSQIITTLEQNGFLSQNYNSFQLVSAIMTNPSSFESLADSVYFEAYGTHLSTQSSDKISQIVNNVGGKVVDAALTTVANTLYFLSTKAVYTASFDTIYGASSLTVGFGSASTVASDSFVSSLRAGLYTALATIVANLLEQNIPDYLQSEINIEQVIVPMLNALSTGLSNLVVSGGTVANADAAVQAITAFGISSAMANSWFSADYPMTSENFVYNTLWQSTASQELAQDQVLISAMNTNLANLQSLANGVAADAAALAINADPLGLNLSFAVPSAGVGPIIAGFPANSVIALDLGVTNANLNLVTSNGTIDLRNGNLSSTYKNAFILESTNSTRLLLFGVPSGSYLLTTTNGTTLSIGSITNSSLTHGISERLLPGTVQTFQISAATSGITFSAVSVSTFFTDIGNHRLASDTSGNPTVNFLFHNGKIVGTQPGIVVSWTNVTNTGNTELTSLKLNDTIPTDWAVLPSNSPSNTLHLLCDYVILLCPVHIYFVFANGTRLEITRSSMLTVSLTNSQTVTVSIANLTATRSRTALAPGESLLVSVRIWYKLIGTSQPLISYPRTYTLTTNVFIWMQATYTGGEASSSSSASFKAYAKVIS